MNTPVADPLPRVADGVVLRRLGVGDLAAFQAYRLDPELGRYQGWSPMSPAEATDFLSAMGRSPLFVAGAWSQVGIAECSDPRLIGDIGLFLSQDMRQVEVGVTLRSQSRRRGLAGAAVGAAITLAFERTAAERVLGITDARHLASVRLLQRLGMRRVETKPVVFRGDACVGHVYAVARAGG